MNKIFAIALAATALLGCTQTMGEFSILTTKSMDITQQLYRVDDRQRLEGDDSIFVFFGIPFGSIPHMKEAIDNAVESDPRAVALSDAKLTRYRYILPMIGTGLWGIRAEGNAVYEEKRRQRRR